MQKSSPKWPTPTPSNRESVIRCNVSANIRRAPLCVDRRCLDDPSRAIDGRCLTAPNAAATCRRGAISVRVHHRSSPARKGAGGRKFDQPRIQLLAESILGEVPERLRPVEGQEPFSITFADVDPVSLSFADDMVTFTVRGKAFTSGERKFDGMHITGKYKLSSDGHGLKAVRNEDFDITPPGFQRGKDKLNTREIVLKRILQEKFGKALPTEIVRTGEPLEGSEQTRGCTCRY
jgi:hypothetical protein